MSYILKCIFGFIIIVIILANTFSQSNTDKIIKKDKTEIIGKVLRVTETSVEFDPLGDIPFIIIKRSDIAVLIYSDNTVATLENDGNNNKKNNDNNILEIYDNYTVEEVLKEFSTVKPSELTRSRVEYEVKKGGSEGEVWDKKLSYYRDNSKRDRKKLELKSHAEFYYDSPIFPIGTYIDIDDFIVTIEVFDDNQKAKTIKRVYDDTIEIDDENYTEVLLEPIIYRGVEITPIISVMIINIRHEGSYTNNSRTHIYVIEVEMKYDFF